VADTQASADRRRVLIAEDEALIRLDLAEMLQEEGYDVVGEAGDGETAVRLAEEARAVAGRQEAYLFVQRAELLLTDLTRQELGVQ